TLSRALRNPSLYSAEVVASLYAAAVLARMSLATMQRELGVTLALRQRSSSTASSKDKKAGRSTYVVSVVRVVPESPADLQGMRAKDIVTAIDRKPLPLDLRQLLLRL